MWESGTSFRTSSLARDTADRIRKGMTVANNTLEVACNPDSELACHIELPIRTPFSVAHMGSKSSCTGRTHASQAPVV